jgi:hypothetical protein
MFSTSNFSHIEQHIQPILWSLNDMCERLSLYAPEKSAVANDYHMLNQSTAVDLSINEQQHYVEAIILSIDQACYMTEFHFSDEYDVTRTDVFGTRSRPAVPFKEYVMTRLSKYTRPSLDDMVRSLALIDHLIARYEPYGLALTWRTSHRLFALALTIMIKFNNDFCYTNQYYSRVAGISTKEFSNLEITFLKKIEFGVWLQQEEVDVYAQKLASIAVWIGT